MSTTPVSHEPAAQWREAVRQLAAMERPSASAGEHRAAELIAERLRALGCRARVEEEEAHGGYWWPISLPNAAAAGAGLLAAARRRRPATRALLAAVAAGCGWVIWDDLGHGARWFRRRLLPTRSTWNVVGETGDPDAAQTVALIAHHDAAHSGLVFHPALGRVGPAIAPGVHARSSHTFPILYAVWAGPVIVAAGSLLGIRGVVRAGIVLSLGAVAAMADIGRARVVPGANDNLTAVGAVLAVAEALREQPLAHLRVLLLSTGSEESFSEGMQGFARRHFPHMDRRSTEFLCLECLGSETLSVLEGEGMLKMRDYPRHMRDALADAATRAGVRIARGVRTVAATDALVALRAGYPVATLVSVEPTKLPRNYHWPSDTPDGLRWRTVEDAIATCESFLRVRAGEAALRCRAGQAAPANDGTASGSSSRS
ncbi:MAG TPA: M28 family peptidase [Solirubrobacteraceae bacterium]|nr:M28 family peptidase [Solirubrobacteraceae bacterium]